MSESELFDQVRGWVQHGFLSKAELFQRIGYLSESAPEVQSDPSLDQKLRGYAANLLKKIDQEEASWREITTNDRIDAAFEELRRRGLFAAQCFTCCSSCGHAEAGGEMDSQGLRGYVFYHQQDTESAAEGHGLYLGYSAREASDEAAEAIGKEICRVLARYGLAYQWSGSSKERIFLKPFTWKKRRVSSAPLIPVEEPWRVFRQADGQIWALCIQEGKLRLRFRDREGEVSERLSRSREPNQEASRLIQEQLADGFVELDPSELPPLPD